MRSELRHMARAGKTFFFASLWLPREIRNDAAIAYTFCRAVDDIADESASDGSVRLQAIEQAIRDRVGGDDVAGRVLPLIERYPSIEAPLLELVRACAEDGPGVHLENAEDLQRYSEGVAGTVGRLLYPLLGGSDPRGEGAAVALGVAMQCTNIARDVIADVRNGRVYLPRQWSGGLDIEGVLREDPDAERRAVEAVERLLQYAAERYEIGLGGLQYLRSDCRRAIEIAARCYAAIGSSVIVEKRLARTRAVVPLGRKISIALSVVLSPRSEGTPLWAVTK